MVCWKWSTIKSLIWSSNVTFWKLCPSLFLLCSLLCGYEFLSGKHIFIIFNAANSVFFCFLSIVSFECGATLKMWQGYFDGNCTIFIGYKMQDIFVSFRAMIVHYVVIIHIIFFFFNTNMNLSCRCIAFFRFFIRRFVATSSSFLLRTSLDLM